ncbi:MAG TPA: DHH family phosphoesterase [Bacilli bacterium]|mgnify:CR=1 FL=1|nr:DHH family phosphoesterase [Bacilli bacterium]
MNYRLIGDNNYFGDLQEEYFKNRGIKDVAEFKNLHNYKTTSPYDFINMKEAIECFDKHIDTSVIGIIVDDDADGFTSSSLMYSFIKENFENEIIYIIHDKNKTHGIKMDELEPYVDKIKLLIVPDAGTNDFEEHKQLKEKNIDVIILDHHITEGCSKDAIVVNNKMSNVSVNLTGVAMVYKFIEALAEEYNIDGIEKYLDLVMMGLIGDSADTKDLEVQYYIQQGLKRITNPMINALIEKESFSLKGQVNQESFGWYLCPNVNAVVRLGSKEQKTLLFEAFAQIGSERTFNYEPIRGKNKGEVIEETLYEYCARFCSSLKAKQQREVKNIIEGNTKVEGIKNTINDSLDKKVLIVDITDYIEDSELTGLIANKLMGLYKKPVIALHKVNDNQYGGSGRGEQIINFRSKLNESKLLEGQGHESAFGIMKTEINNINELENKINQHFKDENIETCYMVDFIIPYNELEDYMIEDLYEIRDYWGQGMPSPLLYIENVEVNTNDIKVNDKKTTISFNANFIQYIKFNCTEDYIDEIIGWEDKMYYNIIGRPSINEYEGERYIQIQIVDMELVNKKDNEENEWDDSDWKDDEDECFEW